MQLFRRYAPASLLILAIAVGAVLARQPAPATADAGVVNMQNIAFNPAGITIAAGTTITWTNLDQGITHTATADDGSFDSGVLQTGDAFSLEFDTPGVYTYHCDLHPDVMFGTITVTP